MKLNWAYKEIRSFYRNKKRGLYERSRRRFYRLLKNRSKQKKPRNLFRQQNSAKVIYAPKYFSLSNPDGLATLFSDIDIAFRRRKKIFVDLTRVEEIDNVAVAILISSMQKFRKGHVEFNGNFPKENKAIAVIVKSGFLDWLSKVMIEGASFYTSSEAGGVLSRADHLVDSSLGEAVMKYATKKIWGEFRICSGLQRVLLELMHNTNNHASGHEGTKGEERWFLAMNFDEESKVMRFAFIDYGVGIFKSLNGKTPESKWHLWQNKFNSKFGNTSNEKILKHLLTGELHRTVTGKSFRGKGLPGIGETLARGQIMNLQVLTNNVMALPTTNEYRLLTNNFDGTCVYWELAENCKNEPWTIQE